MKMSVIKVAVAADLEPIERALKLLCERCKGISGASAVAGPGDRLNPEDESRAPAMTGARRAEFIGGRQAARSALLAVGSDRPTVTSDDHGVPIFQLGYLGSIAHKHGRAVAVATRSGVVQGIGIDLEFDEDHDEESLRAEVVTTIELPQLERIRAAEPSLLSPATLVLAAKEALYKAVFPITRSTFDFDEVELLFDAQNGSFHADRFPGHERLAVRGEYVLANRWILAIATATPAVV